jgi:hypothetical protein
VNLYSYVGNNSLGFVDPMGLSEKPATVESTSIGNYIIWWIYGFIEFSIDNTIWIETAISTEEWEEINEYDFATEIGVSEEDMRNAWYIWVTAITTYTGYKLYKNVRTWKITKVLDNKTVNWNSLDSPKKTYLYDLENKKTWEHLKYWITSQQPPIKRYTNTFMEDKNMYIINSWTRREMYTLENQTILSNPRGILQKNNH